MSIVPIVLWPNKILRKVSVSVEEINDDIRKIVEVMETTLYANGGAGLSAVQIGVPLRILIVDPRVYGGTEADSAMTLINPEVKAVGDEMAVVEEGCLSFPGNYVKVSRHKKAHVRARNQYGTELDLTAEDFLARVIQHEYDHLEGKLLFDHASSLRKNIIRRKTKKMDKRRKG